MGLLGNQRWDRGLGLICLQRLLSTELLSLVTHLGSGFQPLAELLPARLARARDWSGTRGLLGRLETCWGFSQLVPAVGRAWPCLEGKGGGLAVPAPVLLPPRSQAKGRVMQVVLLLPLTLFVSSAACRVPRSSVPSVTPSRLPETFGASTYEGPSRRAGPSYGSAHHTKGEKNDSNKKKTF